jgi:cell division protein FtsL
MILIEKISIFCVLSFIFIFDVRPTLVESGDIDKINTMLMKENIELSKLKKEIKNQTKILNRMGLKEHSNLKKQRILDGQLKIKERELKIYNWNLKINKKKINALTKKITQGEKQIYLHQKNLGDDLEPYIKMGIYFLLKSCFPQKILQIYLEDLNTWIVF